MIDLTKKIAELNRQIKYFGAKAENTKHQHIQERYLALCSAKKQHVRDLRTIQKHLTANQHV